MKLFIVTENYYAGGMDTFLVNLINHWPADDDFILACNYDHPGIEIIERRLRRKCRIIRHHCPTRRRAENRPLLKSAVILGQYILFCYYILYFYLLAKRESADKVIICNGGYPAADTCRAMALSGLFNPKWGKPLFVYHNTPFPARPLKLAPEFFIDWLLQKSVSSLVTVSEYTQRQLYCRPFLARSTKKKVIYNAVETPNGRIERADTIREELKIEVSDPIILMMGTYEYRKGHQFLLQSFQRIRGEVKNAKLIMAGYGNHLERERITSLITQFGLDSCAFLLGFRNDVGNLLSESQVLAVPSQGHESFGLMIIEAMSYKVPVVATDICGIPEVIQDNRGGFTVDVDADIFAEKIILLLKDDNLRSSVGEEGLKVYRERFLPERMSREYYSLLK